MTTKLIVDCSTGITTEVELTAEEIAEREAMAQRGQLLQQSRQQSIAVNQERYNLQREAMRERASESVQTAEGASITRA